MPHVILINLGTNDLFRGGKEEKPALTQENYLGAYRDFIKRLRELYPEAQIIAAIGPMALEPLAGWVRELATGDDNVHALIFEKRNGKEYYGGNWHPSVAMHKIMADTLAGKLGEIMGWK